MVEDQFFDFEGALGFMWMKGWRCMSCGHAADPVIEANHRLQEAAVLVRPSEEAEYENAHVYRRAKPVTGRAA
jgi:glutamate-1-semialdehyde aminotransferase